MNLVLDSSLALAFVLGDEATPETDHVLRGFGHGTFAFAPPLLRWEVGSVLLLAERRQRITHADAQRHLLLLKRLPIEIDDHALEEAWGTVLSLARKHGLTGYDAAYLELAMRRRVALGSLDRELRTAAKAENVPLVPEKI